MVSRGGARLCFFDAACFFFTRLAFQDISLCGILHRKSRFIWPSTLYGRQGCAYVFPRTSGFPNHGNKTGEARSTGDACMRVRAGEAVGRQGQEHPTAIFEMQWTMPRERQLARQKRTASAAV